MGTQCYVRGVDVVDESFLEQAFAAAWRAFQKSFGRISRDKRETVRRWLADATCDEVRTLELSERTLKGIHQAYEDLRAAFHARYTPLALRLELASGHYGWTSTDLVSGDVFWSVSAVDTLVPEAERLRRDGCQFTRKYVVDVS